MVLLQQLKGGQNHLHAAYPQARSGAPLPQTYLLYGLYGPGKNARDPTVDTIMEVFLGWLYQ